MQISIELSDHKLAKLLGLARERGIAYWCSNVRTVRGGTIYDTRTIKLLDQQNYYPLDDGKWVLLDSVEHRSVVLNRAKLVSSLVHIALNRPHTWFELVQGGPSVALGDLLVQCAVFGEPRYAPGTELGKGAVYVCKSCGSPPPCRCLTL